MLRGTLLGEKQVDILYAYIFILRSEVEHFFIICWCLLIFGKGAATFGSLNQCASVSAILAWFPDRWKVLPRSVQGYAGLCLSVAIGEWRAFLCNERECRFVVVTCHSLWIGSVCCAINRVVEQSRSSRSIRFINCNFSVSFIKRKLLKLLYLRNIRNVFQID